MNPPRRDGTAFGLSVDDLAVTGIAARRDRLIIRHTVVANLLAAYGMVAGAVFLEVAAVGGGGFVVPAAAGPFLLVAGYRCLGTRVVADRTGLDLQDRWRRRRRVAWTDVADIMCVVVERPSGWWPYATFFRGPHRSRMAELVLPRTENGGGAVGDEGHR